MRKTLDTLLLTALVAVFGIGGYKLGSKKERIEVFAAIPPAAAPRESGLPQAGEVQTANTEAATSSAPTVPQDVALKPAQAAAVPPAKPATTQVLGSKVTKTPAPVVPAAPAVQPSVPAVAQQPAAEPQPTTKVS
ncbi:hypothetical protein HGA34_02470 [Candidatus Falkowbacteria bacterium]|nr:hypothetical protein [Candidatus Falkowbacteria bacterium]